MFRRAQYRSQLGTLPKFQTSAQSAYGGQSGFLPLSASESMIHEVPNQWVRRGIL